MEYSFSSRCTSRCGFSHLIYLAYICSRAPPVYIIFCFNLRSGLVFTCCNSNQRTMGSNSSPVYGNTVLVHTKPMCHCIAIVLIVKSNIHLCALFVDVNSDLSAIWNHSDWCNPKFENLNFPMHAAEFENAAPGSEVSIPINPNWKMKLVKKP